MAKIDTNALARPAAAAPLEAHSPEAEVVVTTTAEPAAQSRFSILGLLRHWKLISLIAGPIAVLGCAAAWVLFTPEYEATATLLVSPTQSRVLYQTEDDQRWRFFQQFLKSQVAIIESRTILERVLANAEVRKTNWFRSPETSPLGAPRTDLERLIDTLDVTVSPGTFLISITARTRSPLDAVVLANVTHDEFLKYSAEERSGDTEMVFEMLTPEEQRLRNSIEDRSRRGAEALLDLRVTSPESLVQTRGVRLDEQRIKLQELERELAVLERQKAQIDSRLNSDAGAVTGDAAEQTYFAADREWQNRRDELQKSEQAYSDMLAWRGEKHPSVEAASRRVANARQELEKREGMLREQRQLPQAPVAMTLDASGRTTVPLDPQALEDAIVQRRFEVEQLRTDVEREENEFVADFQKALQFSRDSETLQRDKNKYGLIRQRLDELQVEGAVASIRAAARAAPPSRPSNWKQPIMVGGLAVFGGLGLGCFVAGYRGTTRPVAHDFSRQTGTPVLGMLPRARSGAPLSDDEQPMQSEYIRIVRTSILQRLANVASGTIAVTSAGPAAGKTTVSIMLARSLAASGKRVLLVDTDLRRPNVAKSLKLSPRLGIGEVLSGMASDEDAILASESPNLRILPVGPLFGRQCVELLANGALTTALRRWRQNADFVIFDCSPVLPVADARMLLSHSDGVILVAREGRCRREELLETLDCITESGGKLLGTVFVGAEHVSSYRNRYYEYYTS